jgi:hypothetical protein
VYPSVTSVINELCQVFFQATNCGVQQVQFKQGQKRYNNLMGLAKMADNACKIAHGTKKTMQKNQGFTLSFFYELELSVHFDFVW